MFFSSMNSIIEVSQNIIAIMGTRKPSEFRLNQLRQSIELKSLKNIESQEIYFCKFNERESSVSKKEYKELSTILGAYDEEVILDKNFLILSPRIGTISPWSSKATEIVRNCGINHVERIEKGICYFVKSEIDSESLLQLGNSLVDKMTQ